MDARAWLLWLGLGLAGCDPASDKGSPPRADESQPDPDPDSCTPQTWYPDADGDGYGDETAAVDACVAPDGAVAEGRDCDDTRRDVHPGRKELCDGVDQDCDGYIDERVDYNTYYEDADGDGYGVDEVEACSLGEGLAVRGGDCDDADPTRSPGAEEVCDGVDQDCDGAVDDDTGDTWYADRDSDGYGRASDTTLGCTQPAGYVPDATDCDDGHASAHPGGAEGCDSGIDEDCDGLVDCEDETCSAEPTCFEYDCADDLDGDDDGYTDCADEDCWSPDCGTVIRTTVRGGTAAWRSGRDYAEGSSGECGFYAIYEYHGSGTFSSVTGTVRVRRASDTTWRTCDWRVERASPWARAYHLGIYDRDTLVYVTASGSTFYDCGDTVTRDGSSSVSTGIDREGSVVIDPACGVDSAIFPMTLDRIGGGDFDDSSGHRWYDVAGGVLETGEAHVVFGDGGSGG